MAKARVKFGPGWRGLKAHLEGLEKRLDNVANDIVSDIAEQGADRMQQLIVYSGRVDTTLMYRSVSHTKGKSSYYYGRFGWGLNGQAYEDYFRYQEQGFYHVRAGRKIPPMHAMFQAFVEAREALRARLKEIER